MFNIKTGVSTTAWKTPRPLPCVRLAPMTPAYDAAMMMDDVGACHLVYDLWFFDNDYKTWRPFSWFLDRGGGFFIRTCEQWRENTSLKAEDKLRKGKLVRVAFRKPLSQVKLQALMAATYPKIKVLGPVNMEMETVTGMETNVKMNVEMNVERKMELRRKYGQYAPMFYAPMFLPTSNPVGTFSCCQGMHGNTCCLTCEVCNFHWKDIAFPPMPDPELLLHEAAERTLASGRTVTVQEVMAGYKGVNIQQ